MDSGSTSKREFYCQDVLWQTFSELALQRRTTEDTLINEAMRSFLQMNGIPLSRALGAENPGQVIMGGNQPGGAGMGAPARQMGMGAQPRMTQQGMPSMGQPGMQPPMGQPGMQPPMGQPGMQPPMGQPGMQPPMGQPGMQPPPISAHVPIQPRQQVPVFGRQPAAPTAASGGYRAPAPAPVQGQALQGGRVPPPSPNYRRPPSVFEDPASDRLNGQQMALASLAEPRQPYGQGPQAVAPIGPQATAQYGQPPLYIIFANQKYTVDKDKYIIGRSSQLADLVIRDANISRKHCAVIYKNGAYYIKDLDSTNGIEFKGNRIDTKRIEEGDVFNICEFSFQFTYR